MKWAKLFGILFIGFLCFSCNQEPTQQTEEIQTEVIPDGPVKIKGDFAHVVYFWLKNPESEEDRKLFTES